MDKIDVDVAGLDHDAIHHQVIRLLTQCCFIVGPASQTVVQQ